MTDHFAVLGYHVDGSTGRLFLHGIVVGAAAMLGLSLLLAGANRSARRRRASRRELKHSRGQTTLLQRDNDELAQQIDDQRAGGPAGAPPARPPPTASPAHPHHGDRPAVQAPPGSASPQGRHRAAQTGCIHP